MGKVTHLTPDRSGNPAGQKPELAESGGSTGEALRAARERLGGDLSAAARVLNIRKDHLAAIEENRLEALPGRTYALGFVRAYAGYLGIDANACVERFKQETAGRSDATPQIGFLAGSEPFALPYGKIFVTALLALIVLYGGYYLFRPAGVHFPRTAAPAHRALPASSSRPAGVRPHAARSRPVVPTAAAAVTPGAAQPGAASGNSAAATAPEAPPAGQILGMQNKNVRVILHARAATHLLVQGPGGKVYLNRILHPGDAYRVPNLVGLLLTTPDGGAVSLELDGQNVGLAGPPGQMTEALSLDPQAIVDRSSAAKRGANGSG